MSDLNQLDRTLTNILEESWEIFWKDIVIYLLASLLVMVISVASLGLLGGVMSVGFALLVKERRGWP